MNGHSFLQISISRFKEYKKLGDACFDRLSDAQLHYQPNAESNSIAIIVQHMHGNMLSRWTDFLTADGEKSWRKRDEEFEEQRLLAEELRDLWEEGWKVVFDTLEKLSDADLQKNITIRQQHLSVVDAIVRQVAHYSYHIGQMVYVGKILLGDGWQSLSIPKKK